MCGDATDPQALSVLFASERSSLTVTSPPYNIGHSASLGYRRKSAVRPGAKSKYIASADRLSDTAYLELLNQATENALSVSSVAIIVIQQVAGNKVVLMEYLHRFRRHLVDTAIWDKQHAAPAMARNVMTSRFEFILFLSPEDHPKRSIPTASFRGTVPNVYAGGMQRANRYAEFHGATFPIHLPTWLIQTFDGGGGIIFDPFLGTGTTLITADSLGHPAMA